MEKGKNINRYMTVRELNYNISLYRKKGDLSARDRLFEAYKPMVDKIVANIVETDATVEKEKEDLLQDGCCSFVGKEKEDLLQDGYCSLLTYFKEGYIKSDSTANSRIYMSLCLDIYSKAYPYLPKNSTKVKDSDRVVGSVDNGENINFYSLLEKVKTRENGVSREKEIVLLKYNVINPELVDDDRVFEKSEDSLCFNDTYELMVRYAELSELPEKVNYVLSTLTEREEDVIRLRFGMEPKHIKINPDEDRVCEFKDVCKTLSEVSKYFNVNSERVRQIECKALRKLRHRSRARHLKYFLTEEE